MASLLSEQHWEQGQFFADYYVTRALLEEHGINDRRVHLEKGWFSDTLTSDFTVKHSLTKVSLVMMDCDIYSSCKEALDFCRDLLADYSVIFFDDWGAKELHQKNQGERRAFEEFLKENPSFFSEPIGSYKSPWGEEAGWVVTLTRNL